MKSMEQNLQGWERRITGGNTRKIFEMLLCCKEKANQAWENLTKSNNVPACMS